MSLRSPLGKVLGLGAAKDGTSHFWGQRVSALALLFLGLWFVISLAMTTDFGHAAVIAEIQRPVNGILLLLLLVTMAYHSQLGVQVVIEDYVHTHGRRLVALVLSHFTHVFFAAAAMYSILKIGLGA